MRVQKILSTSPSPTFKRVLAAPLPAVHSILKKSIASHKALNKIMARLFSNIQRQRKSMYTQQQECQSFSPKKMGSSTRKSISVPVVMHMDSSSSFITYSTISICMSRFFTFVSTHTLQGIFILLRPLSKSPDLQLSIFLMGLRIPSLCICQTIINDSLSPFLLYLQLLKHFFYFEFHPSRYVHLSIETFTFSLLLSIIL